MAEDLTADQEVALVEFQERAMAQARATGPVDRAAAEAAIRRSLAAVGEDRGQQFIWAESPRAAVLALAEVNFQGKEANEAQKRSWARDRLWEAMWGGQESYWIQTLLYAKEHLALELLAEDDELLQALEDTCNIGWWWPYEEYVAVSERPTILSLDQDGQLHSADGPAVQYPDGWALYMWHGTAVPAELVEGDGYSVEQIFGITNAEVRRCAIERMGWDRFVVEADLDMVSSAPDPGNNPYTLDLYDLPDSLSDLYQRSSRILICTNGSPEPDGHHRKFGLLCPATHSDPVEAAADLYGTSVDIYSQIQRRT